MLDILVIAPHPDDAELGMGGAIVKFVKEGRRVGILDLTSGEPTPHGSLEIRARETAAATSILGIDWRENLGLPNRYEKWAPDAIQNGDSYTSFYFGVNYYIYGNKLKLMNGIEYSIMDGGLAKKGQTNDFDGYTFFSGLRFYF